jgi:4-hydroxy-3-methylbut-2-enyl diphosphate reductase
MLGIAMKARHGSEEMATRFYSFDTICSATQDRQDAVRQLEKFDLDLMIVIGGYNSSNTNNLTKIASSFTRTFHIEEAGSIVDADTIRHKPAGSKQEIVTRGWFTEATRTIGITAGASTPNNQIGETIERILSFRGTMDLATIIGAH